MVKIPTVKSIIKQAKGEVTKKMIEEAKSKYIYKLEELNRAKKVVRNIERELEELELEIENDIS